MPVTSMRYTSFALRFLLATSFAAGTWQDIRGCDGCESDAGFGTPEPGSCPESDDDTEDRFALGQGPPEPMLTAESTVLFSIVLVEPSTARPP
jgi:hypothetical protein